MAKIQASVKEKVFKINRWLGVNESPDGDTGLRMGEASVMQNFRITDDYSLQTRPGSKNVAGLLTDYSVIVGEEEQIILTELNHSTASFQVFPNITVSDTGLLSLSGTEATLNYASKDTHANYYYKDNEGRFWKFDTCVYTQATTGTIVSGGSVNIATDSIFITQSDWHTINAAITAYSGFKVSNGSVEYDGNSNYIQSSNPTYKYYKHDNVMYEITSSQTTNYVNPDGSPAYTAVKWYGKKITFAENDKYEWKFYPVTAQTGATDTAVRGIWSGFVGGTEYIVGACNGRLWSLSIDEQGVWSKSDIGIVDTDNPVHMYGFDDKLYLINGSEYKVWDGEALANVTGYRPLVSVARSPDGANQQALEQVNLLNGQRRVWFSPNGTDKDFILPEKPVASVDYVKNLTTGDNINPSDYTVNTTDGKVTFTNAPTAGTNTIEIGYTVSNSARSEVTAMRYSEIYNGVTDNRVFLYGDGSNKAIYSGLDYNGQARADYFPALNTVLLGDSSTPITGMQRHYSELIAFKTDGAFAINYDTITLPEGQVTAGFYVRPINSVLGNEALGQVQLVENNPRTLESGGIYEWRIATGAVHDQRNADRISQRVGLTLMRMDLPNAVTFYDKINHEYYVMQDGKMLVNNVENDTWYIYENLPATCMITYKDELYIGTTDGYIRHLSREYMSDNGDPIQAYWQSGSMDFGAGHLSKYSDTLWVGVKPESYGVITVGVDTNRYTEAVKTKSVASGFFSFLDLDFTRLSFNTSDKPQMEKLRIKAKNFSYYTLIFSSDSNNTRATITNADIKVRYTGYVR
jgi:hypothetical protein